MTTPPCRLAAHALPVENPRVDLISLLPSTLVPLAGFLLTLGIIHLAFVWVWTLVNSVIAAVVGIVLRHLPVASILTYTIGYYLLFAFTLEATLDFIREMPGFRIPGALLGLWSFYAIMSATLYDDYSTATKEETPKTRMIMNLCIAVVLLWVAAFCFSLTHWSALLISIVTRCYELIGLIASLPFVGAIVGVVGVIFMIILSIRAFFATLGIIEYLKAR